MNERANNLMLKLENGEKFPFFVIQSVSVSQSVI